MNDPLLGRYLMLDSPDGKHWTLARFDARLTRHLYLMRSLMPDTGEPNEMGSYVANLRLFELMPGEDTARGTIFEDLAAVRRFIDWVEEPPKERVVKLVPKKEKL